MLAAMRTSTSRWQKSTDADLIRIVETNVFRRHAGLQGGAESYLLPPVISRRQHHYLLHPVLLENPLQIGKVAHGGRKRQSAKRCYRACLYSSHYSVGTSEPSFISWQAPLFGGFSAILLTCYV